MSTPKGRPAAGTPSSVRPGQPSPPQAPPAPPKRPSGPHRRDRGTPGRRRPRSSSRSPSVPVGAAHPGRANSRRCLPPSRVGAHVRRRRANPARRCRPPTGAAPTSAPSGAAASTTIRRENPASATEMGRITRSRGCATAATPTTATTAQEYRARPRSSRSSREADSWEYDI